MSEKSAQTKKKIAKNADKITIAILALIFAGLLYAWWLEQNSNLGADAATGKDAVFQDQLAESPAMEMLQNMSGQPALESSPEIKRVADLNMFDFTTIQAEAAVETQAQAQVAQARTLIDQGQIEEARPLLKNALNVMSYNPDVKKMLDEITTQPVGIGSPDAGMGAPVM